MHRYGRQTKLVEVGAIGQARIARARVDVHADGLAGEVAARYLAGAGVGCVRVRTEHLASVARAVDPAVEVEVVPALECDVQRTLDDFRDPAARAVAQGAYLALRALRAAIDGAS
jgi:proline racemase